MSLLSTDNGESDRRPLVYAHQQDHIDITVEAQNSDDDDHETERPDLYYNLAHPPPTRSISSRRLECIPLKDCNCGDRLLRLVFMSIRLLQASVILGVIVLISRCFDPSVLESDKWCIAKDFGLIIPVLVAGGISWFLSAVIRYCLPARVTVFWQLPHVAAIAADRGQESLGYVTGIPRAVFSRFHRQPSPEELTSWALNLSPNEKQSILAWSQEMYEAQQWEQAFLEGKTLAVVRSILGACAPEAEAECVRDVLEDSMRRLVEVGFSENRARKALHHTRGNVQMATNWLLEHEDDAEIDSPLPEDRIGRSQHVTQSRAGRGSDNGWKCSCGVVVSPGAPGSNLCSWKKEVDVRCDGCNVAPIVGLRWKCTECEEFDLCEACHIQVQTGIRSHRHTKFREVSAHYDCCCLCALRLRGWTMSNFESWSCRKCKARKASEFFSKLGMCYKHLGRFASAIEILEERLAIVQSWGDTHGEIDAHDSLAICFRSMGMVERAISHSQQELRMAREHGHTRAHAVASQRLAECYASKGDYLLAIDILQECLPLAGTLDGETSVLKLCSNVTPHDHMLSARSTYQPVILMEENYKLFEVMLCQNLANCYYHVEKYSTAIANHEKAREIMDGRSRELKAQVDRKILEYRDQQMHGNTFRDTFSWAGLLGIKYGDVNAGLRARELKKSLKSLLLKDTYLDGEIYGGLGRCYVKVGQYRRAIELHKQHLGVAVDSGDKAGQAAACNDMALALQRMNDFEGAAQILVRSLCLHQHVEQDMGSQDDWRVSLFELQQIAYIQLQKVLLHMGHAKWAVGVCAKSKARALAHRLDDRSPNLGAGAEYCGNETSKCSYEDLCSKWWEELLEFARSEGVGTHIVDFSVLDDGHLAIWVLSGGDLLGSVTVPSTALQQILAEARKSMNVRGRDAMAPPRSHAKELLAAKAPNDKAAGVTPASCAVSSDAVNAATSGTLNGADEASESHLRAPRKDLSSTVLENARLRELYTRLIAPVEQLLEGAEELLIIPHRELFEVPWAALVDAHGRYLIERHVLRVAPSLRVARQAADKMASSVTGSGHVVIVGNPLPIPAPFKPLPEAEKEADKVETILNKAGVMVDHQRHFFKADRHPKATKEKVVQALNGAEWAHVACHGDLDTDSLVLASQTRDDGEATRLEEEEKKLQGKQQQTAELTNLSMREVQDLVKLSPGATVSLSACNTGRGEIKAEGVVGIARAFLVAGAAATVVSLWSVDDGSTAALMEHMYMHLAKGLTVPQALRLAMLCVAGRPLPAEQQVKGQELDEKVGKALVTASSSSGRGVGDDAVASDTADDELDGFTRAMGGGTRGVSSGGPLDDAELFAEILAGDSEESSRRCAPKMHTPISSQAGHLREDEAERKAYWREFCVRDVAPTCVIDFPYDDYGPAGLNLSKDAPDDRLLERIYCFEDREDETHLRRVVVKAHTLVRWRDRREKRLWERAAKVTAVKVTYAYWNPETDTFELERGSKLQPKGSVDLKLVPVDDRLRKGWREEFRQKRYDKIEWIWNQKGSMPAGEDAANADVVEVYEQLRETIRMGESIFPKGATEAAMKGYHSGWKETAGVFQTNKMLRDGREVECEVFVSKDVAAGLKPAWKRPMHWAGFLVVGASTRLPMSRLTPREVIGTIEDWLQSISLQQYSEAVGEYGYDSLLTLDAASEEDLQDMMEAVGMKKPHRRVLIEQWTKRVSER